MGKTFGPLEEYTPAAARDMVKVVPTVVLHFLHVELHPADLVGVIVLCHEPVAVVVVQGGVKVSGSVDDDVNVVFSHVMANRKPRPLIFYSPYFFCPVLLLFLSIMNPLLVLSQNF